MLMTAIRGNMTTWRVGIELEDTFPLCGVGRGNCWNSLKHLIDANYNCHHSPENQPLRLYFIYIIAKETQLCTQGQSLNSPMSSVKKLNNIKPLSDYLGSGRQERNVWLQRLTFPFLDFARLGAMEGVMLMFFPSYGSIWSDSLSPMPTASRDHFPDSINEDRAM